MLTHGERIRRLLAALTALLLFAVLPALAEDPPEEEDADIVEYIDLDEEEDSSPGEHAASGENSVSLTARESFIEDIIALGKTLYEQADGKLQRAHYSSDIYVCKNFTVYLFRKTRDRYRMAEFPDVPLKIPDNQPAKLCKPYYYGYCWKDMTPEEGNPFEVAAQFLYDSNLSKEENMENALEFMRQVQRGDYFQMTAKYAHGTGAHSAIMISDYDPETDTVHWMDSNMAGKKIKGIRYGKVQFDAEKDIRWWAEAFCQKKRGATLYRLRDDIIFAEGD